MSNFNLSDVKKNALLKMAGKQLGKDPQQLQAELEQGGLENVMKNVDAETAGKVNAVLQNPGALQSLLGSAEVQKLLGNLPQK